MSSKVFTSLKHEVSDKKAAPEYSYRGGYDNDLSSTNQEVAYLSKRLEKLELKNNEKKSGMSDSGRSSSSALTKISMGLSMVAAFFIAR